MLCVGSRRAGAQGEGHRGRPLLHPPGFEFVFEWVRDYSDAYPNFACVDTGTESVLAKGMGVHSDKGDARERLTWKAPDERLLAIESVDAAGFLRVQTKMSAYSK